MLLRITITIEITIHVTTITITIIEMHVLIVFRLRLDLVSFCPLGPVRGLVPTALAAAVFVCINIIIITIIIIIIIIYHNDDDHESESKRSVRVHTCIRRSVREHMMSVCEHTYAHMHACINGDARTKGPVFSFSFLFSSFLFLFSFLFYFLTKWPGKIKAGEREFCLLKAGGGN